MTNSTLKRSECDNVRMQVLNDNCEISSRVNNFSIIQFSFEDEI